jgi:hypothetical protein
MYGSRERIFDFTQLCPGAAVYVVQIVAVLLQILGVGVVERQPVTASLQLGYVVVAFPVFVARHAVRVKTVVVRTLELFPLAVNCVEKKKRKKN